MDRDQSLDLQNSVTIEIHSGFALPLGLCRVSIPAESIKILGIRGFFLFRCSSVSDMIIIWRSEDGLIAD